MVVASGAHVSHIAFPSPLLFSSLRALLVIIFLPNKVEDDHLFPSEEPSSDQMINIIMSTVDPSVKDHDNDNSEEGVEEACYYAFVTDMINTILCGKLPSERVIFKVWP
jgi:hypothetical protein